MGKEIRLAQISKKYGENVILEKIDLEIAAGERIVLLGPSGSGKSTLLRMIAGLEEIAGGELYLGDQLANDLECGDRDIAMVFQNYALYPHMTVTDNIVFSLKANKVPKAEVEQRLHESLEMLDLLPYKDRLPKDLSGGQRQRTALARAVVKRSDYFLLDEPLSNLDVRLRLDARMELVKIHDKYQQTFVYVTHDQIEAMTLAHRIVLLNEGKIQMVDTPRNVYLRPTNVFTATFIGSPGMNIFDGKFQGTSVTIEGQSIALSEDWQNLLAKQGQQELLVGIRPEHFILSKTSGELKAQIVYRELLGQSYALTVKMGEKTFIVLSEEDHWQVGDTVCLQIPAKRLHFFSKETQTNLGYPFDLEKGDNIHEVLTSV
ncbi:ABC transporter ATP-binding protein [Enterococcus olivae]